MGVEEKKEGKVPRLLDDWMFELRPPGIVVGALWRIHRGGIRRLQDGLTQLAISTVHIFSSPIR